MGAQILTVLLNTAPYAGYALAVVLGYYCKLFDARLQQSLKRERDLRDDFAKRLVDQGAAFAATINGNTNATRWLRYMMMHGHPPARFELEDPAEIIANIPPPPAA